MVAEVRRFNRTVTQRVGALNDRYLSRSRTLGESRVLWEIGPDGCEIRTLRARLDLDGGYLSRLLRALEADGLVTVGASPGDGRVRTARLTARGRRERSVLDGRSDELARAILAPLDGGQRRRLLTAMAEVERLLTAAIVDIAIIDPEHPDAQQCLARYFAELGERFESGYDPAVARPALPNELRLPAGLMLVAHLHGEPIGCGALKFHGADPAEIKRMWVAPAARGLGLGRRLLSELEARAAQQGCDAVRLETNRALLEAIAMYRSTGYVEVAAFNDEPYGDHWFEKCLPGSVHDLTAI